MKSLECIFVPDYLQKKSGYLNVENSGLADNKSYVRITPSPVLKFSTCFFFLDYLYRYLTITVCILLGY